jgi:hypothetical protein
MPLQYLFGVSAACGREICIIASAAWGIIFCGESFIVLAVASEIFF